MQQGYIKIYRKFQKWEWYLDKNTKILFLHLLLNARHEDGRYRGRPIKKGQLIASRESLARDTGLTQREVRTSIKNLMMTNEITKKSTNRYTLITIVKWSDYQNGVQEVTNETTDKVTNEMTSKRPAGDQASNKNVKNVKKKNSNHPIVPPQRELSDNVKAGTAKATSKAKKEITVEELEGLTQGFKGELYIKIHDFVAFRREMGKPMTLRAVKLFLKHLNELSGGNGGTGIAIIEQSMRNGWQDIYQLKDRQREEKRKVSFADIV